MRRAKDINFTIVTKSLILDEYHMMYIDHAAHFSVAKEGNSIIRPYPAKIVTQVAGKKRSSM